MKKSHTHRAQHVAGFTLVELLVVIAIVGVLVAMLLPALGKAKDAAKVIACGSNQRQVGISLASYATDWHQYPIPYGQTGFDSKIVFDKYLPIVWGGWTGYGTVSWNYTFGLYPWWVGAVTQDTKWYKRKEFMCTASMPPVPQTVTWGERSWNGNDSINYGSMIRGTPAINPVAAENLASPWYLYFSPCTTAVNMYEWWDFGLGTTDVADQVFGRDQGWYNEYKIAPSDGLAYPIITGPRMGDAGRRRAQLCCPNATSLPSGASVWKHYEPHGGQLYAGNQNSRAPGDPEAKNYLYTDGSVKYIFHE